MMRSLQTRLSVVTLSCIALVTIPFLLLSYLKIVEEVNELSDARLAHGTRTLEVLSAYVGSGDSATGAVMEIPNWTRPKGAGELTQQGHAYETQVGLQFWDSPTRLRLATQDLRDLSFEAAPVGFADIVKDKRKWRVFTKIGVNGGFIRAAERYDSRREISRELLLQNAVPFLIGLPLLALLVSWAVRRGLRPLANTTAQLEQRTATATGPMDVTDAPRELEPLIGALNGLLRRLRLALDNERQFTANAAHELRTPLAGALVHVGNAQASGGEAERANALAEARGALERMGHVVSQMLELARWDAAPNSRAFDAVDLARCIDDELDSLALDVLDKDIEIVRSVDSRAHIVRGWEPGIRTLLRNLFDNAIRYGSERGRIEIATAMRGDRILLAVSDNGPGIDPARRSAMMERFQRGHDVPGNGSGLGLSIVARIAQLHDADVTLGPADGGQGTRVDVLFPRPSGTGA